MNKFLYRFDRTITSIWYLALVATVVLIYFGSGVYATYQEKHTERAYRAEYAMKNGMKHCSMAGTGQHCYLENKELVVITAWGGR